MIFDACIEWAQNKCKEQMKSADSGENLRQMLGSCLDRMRFNEIPMVEYKKRLVLYKDMFTKDEIINYFITYMANDDVTRYQYYITFQFEKSTKGYTPDYKETLFRLSRSMLLKRFRLDSSFWHQLHMESANRYTIIIRSCFNGPAIECLIRPAPQYGADWLKFEKAPIFNEGKYFSIDIDPVKCPTMFIAKVQTVRGVQFEPHGLYQGIGSHDIVTCFSEFHFEEPN